MKTTLSFTRSSRLSPVRLPASHSMGARMSISRMAMSTMTITLRCVGVSGCFQLLADCAMRLIMLSAPTAVASITPVPAMHQEPE